MIIKAQYGLKSSAKRSADAFLNSCTDRNPATAELMQLLLMQQVIQKEFIRNLNVEEEEEVRATTMAPTSVTPTHTVTHDCCGLATLSMMPARENVKVHHSTSSHGPHAEYFRQAMSLEFDWKVIDLSPISDGAHFWQAINSEFDWEVIDLSLISDSDAIVTLAVLGKAYGG
jgi:hypothetical protein